MRSASSPSPVSINTGTLDFARRRLSTSCRVGTIAVENDGVEPLRGVRSTSAGYGEYRIAERLQILSHEAAELRSSSTRAGV